MNLQWLRLVAHHAAAEPRPAHRETATPQPTVGRDVVSRITVWGPCPECGGDADYTTTQPQNDKATGAPEVACVSCDGEPAEAAEAA